MQTGDLLFFQTVGNFWAFWLGTLTFSPNFGNSGGIWDPQENLQFKFLLFKGSIRLAFSRHSHHSDGDIWGKRKFGAASRKRKVLYTPLRENLERNGFHFQENFLPFNTQTLGGRINLPQNFTSKPLVRNFAIFARKCVGETLFQKPVPTGISSRDLPNPGTRFNGVFKP